MDKTGKVVIQTDNLTVGYDSGQIFDRLNVKIRSGQNVCLQGRSGSGKSTLLKALMGFVVPTGGRIVIDGDELTGKSVWAVRQKIAYVAQEPDLGPGRVLDRMRQPFLYHANAQRPFDETRMRDYCRRLYLDEQILSRDLGDLSGGEKQRIAVIIALLLDRPILLLDEPISAQDTESKAALTHLLKAAADKTILFVSHDQALLEIADETVDLNPRKEPS